MPPFASHGLPPGESLRGWAWTSAGQSIARTGPAVKSFVTTFVVRGPRSAVRGSRFAGCGLRAAGCEELLTRARVKVVDGLLQRW
jgi:hypothetical protein